MLKILIVDDDKNARVLLHDILSAEGYSLLQAENGRQALEMIGSETVALIITDRTMPEMDGLDLLRKLKERQVHIPTIMISAYGEEKLWGQALELGAQDYLVKPYKTQEVIALVKKTLSGMNPKP